VEAAAAARAAPLCCTAGGEPPRLWEVNAWPKLAATYEGLCHGPLARLNF